MWDNCNYSNPIGSSGSCEIILQSDISIVQHKPLNKQVKFKEKPILASDIDYKSFLLPLEQDFTKSSKGYASLPSTIPNKEYVHCKNKLNNSKRSNTLHIEEKHCLKNTNGKYLHNNSSLNSNNFSNNAENMCCKEYAQIFSESRQNINEDQNSENIFSKGKEEITLDALKNSETDKSNIFSEKPLETVYNYSIPFTNSAIFKNKSDDDDDDSSKLSDTECPYNGCSNMIYRETDSSSDDNMFSEKVVNKKHIGSSIKIEQTFASAVDFDNSESSDTEEDFLKMSETRTYAFSSKESTFEYSRMDHQKHCFHLQNKLCDSLITFSSEGYINACFEDDDILFESENSTFLNGINERWNDSMKDISGEPHESTRVSFVPLPNMISVYSYESEDDGYRYSLHVLDQLRFQNRVMDFEYIIAPYLTSEHRANIYQRNYL